MVLCLVRHYVDWFAANQLRRAFPIGVEFVRAVLQKVSM
jgi:hypothetical protein